MFKKGQQKDTRKGVQGGRQTGEEEAETEDVWRTLEHFTHRSVNAHKIIGTTVHYKNIAQESNQYCVW